ncbi:hypothetical protein HHK36_002518 [Tetracentron sinense]|uniref:Nucleobase-ascorbate transporter 3 n=1 Tax=Tetracentron sinense TaxID=13715 RepID=A0A835DMY2_TETSI|nr:hypothetical protein HHK36_002518 [Tetracentron sinense]
MVETTNQQHPHPQMTAPPPPSLSAPRAAVHPPAEQLHQLHFCIHSNPSWPETIILAFQHYIVMLGTTVMIASSLVPLMGGDFGDKARVIQTLLFMGGINTLLQTFLGTRLPTVMGASFAFVIPVMSIINDFSDRIFTNEHERFVHTMRSIQGALIVSSFFNIVIGYSKAWGNYTRFCSPVVIVPVVCVAGLGLFERGFPRIGDCVEIGLPMLILLVICQQYLKRIHESVHTILERFALLFCIAIVWAFAAILTVGGAYNNVREQTKLHCRTDRSFLISSASWIKIPYPFQWGAPIFRASHVFGMMGAALVSSAESTGTYFVAARLAGATPPPAHVLSRSIGLQGVGMLLDGIFVLLLVLLHLWKFGAFFASIPLPIFAAIYCVLFGLVAAVGISFIQFTNNNSMRNLYILGLSLFLGISIPQYFNEYTASAGHGPVKSDGGWFNDILNTIFSSPPTVAMIVATLLDNTLNAKYTTDDRGYLQRFVHTMRSIQGALIVSSFFNIVIGYSKAWGNYTRFCSPVVIVPVVCVVGLGLFERGFPRMATVWRLAFPCLFYWLSANSVHTILERFALLFCIAIVWAFAAILTVGGAYNNVREQTKLHCRTDRSFLISSASWIKIPYPFQWGAPIFRASHVFGMMGAALVSSAESTGTYFVAARLAGATPPPAHVLSRSIGLQGVGMLLDGIFVLLLVLLHLWKFGAFFASIPLPIFAAIYCVLFGLVAAVGISFIQFTNNNSMRNLYILGLSLFLGISIPQYFNEYTASAGHGPVKSDGGWFNDILNTIFSSPPTVAMIVATLLDNTLNAKYTTDDRGLPWWVPFQNRKGDVRNEEFYGLPLRIHEYIPTIFL